jgi:predicted NAD/FAD-binding protein
MVGDPCSDVASGEYAVKISIGGNGISGLVAPHLLHPRHEIGVVQAVFERPEGRCKPIFGTL